MLEVFRGVFANWWAQGADGIQSFNFAHSTEAATPSCPPQKGRLSTLNKLGRMSIEPGWATHRQLYREMGDPKMLRALDKTFVLQRRGGGHGAQVIANPEDWKTPRIFYGNTNMEAPLPAVLANDGKADTLLRLDMADDLAARSDGVEQVTVAILLSDAEAETLPASQRLEQAIVANFPRILKNTPPASSIKDRIEVRINNILLGHEGVEAGWLIFQARPEMFAAGENLIGLRLMEPRAGRLNPVLIEKLEVRTKYRRS